MYDLLGLSLALAALLTINALASFLATGVWRFLAPFTSQWAAATRAQFLFVLRIFPPTAALLGVTSLLIPSYLKYEPWSTTERVSTKLGFLALLSVIGIGLAIWRGLVTWRRTNHLIADWMQHSRAIQLRGVNTPTYRVEHLFPVIAIIGVIRPRLFIASIVLETLNKDELAAAIAHELGHIEAHDNLKRWLMRACRDVLGIVPSGRALDRAWAEATEAAADEYAAQRVDLAALDLASALVKIARMVPDGMKPTMPAGAFLIGEDQPAGIEARVRHLAEIAGSASSTLTSDAKTSSVTIWACFGSVLFIVSAAAISPHVLTTLHAGVERIVSILS